MTTRTLCAAGALMLAITAWAAAEEPPAPPSSAADEAVLPPAPPPAPEACLAPQPTGEVCRPGHDGWHRQGDHWAAPDGTGAPGRVHHPPTNGHGQGDQSGRPPHGPVFERIEKFKQSNPEEFARLRQLRKDDPEAYRREIRERFRTCYGKDQQPDQPQERDPQHATRQKIQELSRQYHAATNDADKASIEASMRSALNEWFDARQKERQKEIEALQARLKEIQQSLDAHTTNKLQTIEQKIRDLTRDRPAPGK